MFGSPLILISPTNALKASHPAAAAAAVARRQASHYVSFGGELSAFKAGNRGGIIYST